MVVPRAAMFVAFGLVLLSSCASLCSAARMYSDIEARAAAIAGKPSKSKSLLLVPPPGFEGYVPPIRYTTSGRGPGRGRTSPAQPPPGFEGPAGTGSSGRRRGRGQGRGRGGGRGGEGRPAAAQRPRENTTLDVLLALIDESDGGRLLASRVEKLYEKGIRHRHQVNELGGFKKFCEYHAEMLQIVQGVKVQEWSVMRRAAPIERKVPFPKLVRKFGYKLADITDRMERVERSLLHRAWVDFCNRAGEPETRFASVLHMLQNQGVLIRAGRSMYRLVADHGPHVKKTKPMDAGDLPEGTRPALFAAQFESALPFFDMPSAFRGLMSLDLEPMQKATTELLKQNFSLTPMEVPRGNLSEYFRKVLYAEELQMMYDMTYYNLWLSSPLERLANGTLHIIPVPGLAEKRPSVLRGDEILVRGVQGKFKGFVHSVNLDSVAVSFHKRFKNSPPLIVHFRFSRTPLRAMHRAAEEWYRDLLADDPIVRPEPAQHDVLNEEQRAFMSAAVGNSSNASDGYVDPVERLPMMLWGPPGTGKTTTLVHTIDAILRKDPNASILVSTPSNPAADLLAARIAAFGWNSTEVLRLVAVSRDPDLVPEEVKPLTSYDRLNRKFIVPETDTLREKRVIIVTCSSASYLRSRLNFSEDAWFSHVIVDEAAQAMEPEVLLPLSMGRPDSRIILSGDFKQLGPIIHSPVAMGFGLNTSLMERIVNAIGVNHSRVFPLLQTHRSHPSILKLYSRVIYGDMLRPMCPPSSYDMEQWPECPRTRDGKPHPLIFHHIDASESRSKDSPSWKNDGELNTVESYLKQLVEFGVEAEDIGIISPYHKQCKGLRQLTKELGLERIEVGTTELFQGREKRVIIISTVRSREQDVVKKDLRGALGFLGIYKRTNVAISRAKSMLIVVGNLRLLSCDLTWHKVIRLARGMNALRGEEFELQRPCYGQESQCSLFPQSFAESDDDDDEDDELSFWSDSGDDTIDSSNIDEYEEYLSASSETFSDSDSDSREGTLASYSMSSDGSLDAATSEGEDASERSSEGAGSSAPVSFEGVESSEALRESGDGGEQRRQHAPPVRQHSSRTVATDDPAALAGSESGSLKGWLGNMFGR